MRHPCEDDSGCDYRRAGSNCVSHIRLFSSLPTTAKEELLSHAVQSTHRGGTTLVRKGDPIESILIVRKGKIKTFRIDADGEEYVLDVLHDGQALWHGMFLEDHSYHYSVACLTQVSLCSIRRTDFEDMLARHPDAAMSLIRILSTELDDAEEKLMMLGIRDPKRRLAEYLLHRDERCLGGEIDLKLEDIARSINLRPETVSRNFSAFEREGLVTRLGRGRIKVCDHQGLRDVSAAPR